MLAPAACSARAMLAPTRRAAPVISAVRPARAVLTGKGASGAGVCVMGPDYDRIGRALNPAATRRRGAAPQRERRGADPRGAGRRWRLAVVRALHGASAVCARARLL